MQTKRARQNPKQKKKAAREKKSVAMQVAPSNHTGARGVNPDNPVNIPKQAQKTSERSVGAINTNAVIVRVQDRSIAYLAMGIVLQAIRRGSESAQTTSQFPYIQWRYLIDVFYSNMQSSTPLLTNAPKWMWELLYALRPKTGTFKTGMVSYSWDIKDTGQGFDQAFVLGTGEDSYTLWWGTSPTGSAVNGYPVLGPAPIYTQALGATAISSLWTYTASDDAVIADPGPDGVWTGKDTSAFAVCFPELGESYFSEGGVRTTIYSERHMDSPLFCQFGVYQPVNTILWRGWHDARVGAGSPTLIGPTLIEMPNFALLRNKVTPIIKFYNFDEFFEQLSLTLCLALEKAVGFPGLPTSCPFTAQTVQLLLRQAILQVCSNQYAQDIRLSGSQFIDLLPFTVGPAGTTGATSIAMQLPTFLAENIRAMSKISTKVSKKQQFQNSILTWLPILSRPPSQPLNTNYTWGSGTPLYVVDGNEIPINLIDCSTTLAQATVYVDLTRTEMDMVLSDWNTWISGLSSVLSPLVSITSEDGIRAINCNLYTNIQETIPGPPPPVPPAPLTKRNSKESIEKKLIGSVPHYVRSTATVSVGDSYFVTVGERKITNLPGFNKNLDQVMDNFILPVNFSDDTRDDSSTQGYQSFMVEPASKPRSTAGGVGTPGNYALSIPNASERHMRAAAIDIKPATAGGQNNEIIASFQELSKNGRGGFLSSALAGLANMFLPGSGAVVSSVLGG